MFKSLQIGLRALFLDEKVLKLHNVFLGAAMIQQLITPEVFVIEANSLQF